METNKDPINNDPVLKAMFSVGAHYAYTKSRRHPSVKPFIFGSKNKIEIFDLEKTKDLLFTAKEYVKGLGRDGKQILFVSSKHEAKEYMKSVAGTLGQPYVAGRWIGGTFTNFGVIRGRVEKLLDLREKRDKGELAKYTKKERLLIDRDIDRLEILFSGLVPMKALPAAVFVIDPGKESVAVSEAKKVGVPVVALLGSDCDFSLVEYPIVGNDASSASIKFFVDEMAAAYREGQKNGLAAEGVKKQ